jgi:hypothetical protein
MVSDKHFETSPGVIQPLDDGETTERGSETGPTETEKATHEEEEFKEGGYGW